MLPYKEMPSDSRVWVYQSNRAFTDTEIAEIKNKAFAFVEAWTAHGKALRACIEIFYARFVIVFVDEKQALASGCSIDKAFNFIQTLEREFIVKLLDRMLVAYRKEDAIYSCTMPVFQKLIEKNEVNENTIVFNNLVSTKADFESKWEVPLKDSWHFGVKF